MPGSFLSGAPTAFTGVDTYMCGKALIDETMLWRYSPYWHYERRGIVSTYDRYAWRPLWPGSQMMTGDPSSPMGHFGQDGSSGGELYEPYACIGNGNQSLKFIKGTTLDESSNPISDVLIQAYRTVDEVLVGTATSRTDGSYDCPVASPAGVQHYLVAYKAGSPDIAGTTVNTLTPTNVDGT